MNNSALPENESGSECAGDSIDCQCPSPRRPVTEALPPWRCVSCKGFACDYAERGETRCPEWRCDCFIATHPDSPMDLHPEAFIVGHPTPADPQGGDA